MRNGLHHSGGDMGFSLVELLVSMTVLVILLWVAHDAMDVMQGAWRATSARVEQFREARSALEGMARNLGQATLNTCWDTYYKETHSNVPPSDGQFPPDAYARQSGLHFQCGAAKDMLAEGGAQSRLPGHAVFFQAPLGRSRGYRGLAALLNAHGYFVQFCDDARNSPQFLKDRGLPVRGRYRLMEFRPPAEGLDGGMSGNAVYYKPDSWFREGLENFSRVIADNVVLFLVMPRVPPGMSSGDDREPWWIAPAYRYNSKDADNSTPEVDPAEIDESGHLRQGTQHLLPPQLRIALVALDEGSAARWGAMTGGEVDLQHESGAAFADAELYERDMERLKQYFRSRQITCRVFTEVVTLRNARWDSQAFETR